jgi:hypothetical protein
LPRKGKAGWCSPEGWSGGGASSKNQRWTASSDGVGGRMVLLRVEGGVEALRRCGFTEEKEMRGGALDSRYAEAKRGEGREWGGGHAAAWRRKGGGSGTIGGGGATAAGAQA